MINWKEAPEGATHFDKTSGCYSWLKKALDGSFSFHNGKVWVQMHCTNVSNRILIGKPENYAVAPRVVDTHYWKGKHVVLTGEFKGHKRSDVKNYLVSIGLNVVGSVNPGVSALIYGMLPGSKLDKAKSLRIPLFTLDCFLQEIVGISAIPVNFIFHTGNNDPLNAADAIQIDNPKAGWAPVMKDTGQWCLCPGGQVTEGHCSVCGHAWDAPRVVDITWDGEGLPPVGTECLFRIKAIEDEFIEYCSCTILFSSKENIVFEWKRGQITIEKACHKNEFDFKPLKSEHDELVDEMFKDSGLVNLTTFNGRLISKLIKAGYRKHASLNREFSAGATYRSSLTMWTSNINIPGQEHNVEVHAGTMEGAELLRDEILARLS